MEDSWLKEKDLNNGSDLLQAHQLRHGIWLMWTCSWLLVIVGLIGPCLVFYKHPFSESMCYIWGTFLASWAGPPRVRDFFHYLSVGLSPFILGWFILYVWAILVVKSVRVAWVASAISATPHTCAQYYSSTVASACYMNMVILLRCWW